MSTLRLTPLDIARSYDSGFTKICSSASEEQRIYLSRLVTLHLPCLEAELKLQKHITGKLKFYRPNVASNKAAIIELANSIYRNDRATKHDLGKVFEASLVSHEAASKNLDIPRRRMAFDPAAVIDAALAGTKNTPNAYQIGEVIKENSKIITFAKNNPHVWKDAQPAIFENQKTDTVYALDGKAFRPREGTVLADRIKEYNYDPNLNHDTAAEIKALWPVTKLPSLATEEVKAPRFWDCIIAMFTPQQRLDSEASQKQARGVRI